MLKDTMVSFLERVQGIGPWGAVLFAAVYIPAAHDRVARRVARRPTLAAIGRAVETDAFKIVLLTRLSPVFPFNLPNYAYGLTSVPFRTYVLASWIGMLPETIMCLWALPPTASQQCCRARRRDPWAGRRCLPSDWRPREP